MKMPKEQKRIVLGEITATDDAHCHPCCRCKGGGWCYREFTGEINDDGKELQRDPRTKTFRRRLSCITAEKAARRVK